MLAKCLNQSWFCTYKVSAKSENYCIFNQPNHIQIVVKHSQQRQKAMKNLLASTLLK
jgi:hypothetical protein